MGKKHRSDKAATCLDVERQRVRARNGNNRR